MAYTDFPAQNQLQFNLNVPLKVKNLAIQHHRIQPVVIQKTDRHGTFRGPPNVLGNSHSSFQFKSVSEDRMAMAVQMAKRDLRNKKLQGKSETRSRSPSPKSSKTKVIHSREYLERQRKWQLKSKKPIGVRERDKNVQPRTVKTQTQMQSPKPFLNTQIISRLPATTNSPPTRDTDMYPRHKVREDLQPTDDIERLQLEMEGYLEQIKTVEEKALHDPEMFAHRSRSRKKDGYLSDEEDEERRVIRSEEYATRAARNLYNLRQQVRQIQRELLSLGPDSKIKQTKKSQAMSKLAAAHRGAARAIQAFVTDLPHQDLRSGLPSSYQELSLLIRQLTQLSSQIKQGRDSQVQKEVINMLDNVDELSDAWQREIRLRRDLNRESPPRKRSPVSRQLFDREEEARVKQFKGPVRGQNKENKPKGVLKKTLKHTSRFPASKGQPRPVMKSPERQATLRAGIAALMRDRDSSLESRQKPGVSWNISFDEKPPEKKGLLLPAKLQAKREKIHRCQPQQLTDSHFADPTISANMKAVMPLHNPVLDDSRLSSPPQSPAHRSQSHSPSRLGSRRPWRPPGTPTKSPGTPKQRSRSFSPHGSRIHFLEEDIDADIVKQLFPDDEERSSHQSHPHQFERSRKPRSVMSPHRNRSPRTSRRREPLRNSFVSSVVEEAKKRMRPYLKKEAASYPGHHPSRRSTPSPDRSSSFHDDSLSSQFLDDILAETVKDLQEKETRETIHRKAASMRDAPTLEGIFQRLEEMEEEEQDIRRRWATVSYANPEPVSKFFTSKEVLTDRPRSPPAIEVQRTGGPAQQRHVKFSHQPSEEPIIFTKESRPPRWKETYTHKVPDDPHEREPLTLPERVTRPRTLLSVPQSVVSRIVNSQETYSSYLKKMSHHPHGVFQPWKLVEQITDEILRECMEEVTGELDDLNDVIANHLYKSEFMEVKSQPQSPDGRTTVSESRAGHEAVTDRNYSASHGRAEEPRLYSENVAHDRSHKTVESAVGRDISHGRTQDGVRKDNLSHGRSEQSRVALVNVIHDRTEEVKDRTESLSYGRREESVVGMDRVQNKTQEPSASQDNLTHGRAEGVDVNRMSVGGAERVMLVGDSQSGDGDERIMLVGDSDTEFGGGAERIMLVGDGEFGGGAERVMLMGDSESGGGTPRLEGVSPGLSDGKEDDYGSEDWQTDEEDEEEDF